MKKVAIVFGILLVLMVFSCKNEQKELISKEIPLEAVNYTAIGLEISAAGAKNAQAMSEIYMAMSEGDTIITKMIGQVYEVCQSKGCWMKVDLLDGQQVMVKFKDYALFMPKDSAGKEVVLNGKAFVNEIAVDELRHYAEDAGKSSEEIATITEPKKTFSFEADGVLLKDKI